MVLNDVGKVCLSRKVCIPSVCIFIKTLKPLLHWWNSRWEQQHYLLLVVTLLLGFPALPWNSVLVTTRLCWSLLHTFFYALYNTRKRNFSNKGHTVMVAVPISSLWSDGKPSKLAWLQFRLKAPTLHLGKALLSMPGRTCVSKMNKSTKSTVPYSRSSCTQASPPGRANCSASACVLTTCMIGLWWRLTAQTFLIKTGELLWDPEHSLLQKLNGTHIVYVFSSRHHKFLLLVFLTHKYGFISSKRCCFPTISWLVLFSNWLSISIWLIKHGDLPGCKTLL